MIINIIIGYVKVSPTFVAGQPIAEKDGVNINLPKDFESFSLSMIGNYVVTSTHFGLKMIWNGDETIFLKVHWVNWVDMNILRVN